MGEGEMKVGKLMMKDLKTGETFEFDGLKPVELDTTDAPEEHVPEHDGINIHITGSGISKISNIEIYFKEEE